MRTRQVQRWAWFPAQSWPWGLPSDLLKHHRALLCYVSKAAAPLGDRCPPRMLSREGGAAASAGSEKKLLL